MKKLLALILVCITVMSVFPGVASSAENDEELSFSVKVVQALGFMSGYPDGTFKPSEAINRAEFACIISKLLNLDPDLSRGEITPFKDVTDSHWASPYVNIVNAHGLMTGYGNGTFLPENTLTVGEAEKVMVSLLGYSYLAENNGGYPVGYSMQSDLLGLSEGITSDENMIITRGEIAKMLVSSFDVDMYIPTGYGENMQVTVEDGMTILKKYHDIFSVKGIVTANSYTSVNKKRSLNDNLIEVNGISYKIDGENTSAYLGMNVRMYYKVDDNDIKTVLYIEEYKNNVIEINGDDIDRVGNYKIVYHNSAEKEREISFESNTNILWNNQFDCRAINFDLNILAALNGNIIFIDNDDDRIYDIIKVKNYTVGVIESINNSSKKISLKYGATGLSLEDSKFVILKGGKKVELSELNSSDVISIAASKDFVDGRPDGVVEIVVSDVSVSGRVSVISSEGVVIRTDDGNDVECKVSKKFICDSGTALRVGDKGIFHLDPNDKIISLSATTVGEMKFGFLIHAIKKTKVDTSVSLKIFTTAGEVKKFQTAEKVKVDGVSKTAEEMYQILYNLKIGGNIAMVIRYGLNKENLISSVDTELPNSDGDPDALTVKPVVANKGLRYQHISMMLVDLYSSERYIVNPNVTVFAVPKDLNDDDGYNVYTNSYFQNEKFYGIAENGEKLYMCNVKDGFPQAIIIQYGDSNTNLGSIVLSEGPSAVVKQKLLALDEDGATCTKLIVDNHGKDVELFITDKTSFLFSNGSGSVSDKLPGKSHIMTADDINFGDVIMYDAGNKNQARVILRINDTSVHDLIQGTYQVTGMSGYTEFIMGSVRKKDGTVMELDVSTDPNLYINAQRDPYVAIVRKHSSTVTTGTLDDIWASRDDSDADKIFARVRFGSVAELYIYRD